MEWQELCSRAILVVVAIISVPAALLQIGIGIYQLGCFPRFNRLCKKLQKCAAVALDIFEEGPFEFVVYGTALIVIAAVAISKITL